MVITKRSLVDPVIAERRKKANKDCDKCPCCGETRSETMEVVKDDHVRVQKVGIKTWLSTPWYTKVGYYGESDAVLQQDKYRCETCGAEWESDWFRIDE